MDFYIYAAEVYCPACAIDIMQRIRAEGFEPDDPDDESSYDSGEWPKGPFRDEESDSPQHCGSGADCLEPMELADGSRVGRFLEGPLTSHGESYVREMHRDRPSEITRFWMEFYGLDEDPNDDESDDLTDYYHEHNGDFMAIFRHDGRNDDGTWPCRGAAIVGSPSSVCTAGASPEYIATCRKVRRNQVPTDWLEYIHMGED
jgi:hypothetical protein